MKEKKKNPSEVSEIKKRLIKPLLPSLRERNRYIVFEVISKAKFNSSAVFDAICRSFDDLFGQFGLAGAGLMLISWNKAKSKGILRISHVWKDALKSSFLFVKRINNTDVLVKSIATSGTIKKAKTYLLKNQNKQ